MRKSSNFSYIGSELELFAHAVNWKSYWSSLIRSHIRGDVLEVGAGNGNNTRLLYSGQHHRWICLEPDNALASQLKKSLAEDPLYENCEVINETIAFLGSGEKFDTILYIDVLEHIEDDEEELRIASKHLNPGGAIIILSPAFQILYSRFDKSIGHYRRYTKKRFKHIVPSNLRLERLMYLDTAGLIVSMGNRFILKQNMPSLRQIKIWDRFVIPFSRLIDRFTGYNTGKSILAVLSLTV